MSRGSIAFQVLPLYTEEKRSLAAIDRAIAHIQAQQDIHMSVGAFETTLEGEFARLMQVLEEAVVIAGENGEDIFVNVKLRYHKEGEMLTSEDKLAKYRS
ncbi:hypothetical protein CL176_08635 [Suicoccus acidiformans]|uniref:Thiamine-binding protein domain-containing protein n=1 Tax=Suicoccus acidiformans TaxID=2036206 RepID=A0A347WLV5_9LACT|nr:thiamine-binding protein [Suicoccus acidiformans]AXY26062.1 hypothetical protein CL176_08635 [Suicoccus acidiformans]